MSVETATLAPAAESTPPFRMHGARQVLSFTGGAARIAEQVEAIERAVTDSPGFAFDLAKALIETVCKTIHADRGEPVEGTPDLPQIFKDTCKKLQLVPDSHMESTAVGVSLKKTANGMMTAIQGVCELRRGQGTVSHGRDAYEASLESAQAEFVARTADALVGFLYQAHRNYPSVDRSRRIALDDHPEFNDFVDDANDPVQVFELTYRPSEVLFQVDLEAYRDLLADHAGDDEQEEVNGE